MTNRKLPFTSLCTIALVLVATVTAARGAVITLSGGDPGEGSDSIGYAPLNTTVYAYHFRDNVHGGSTATDVVQSVSFQPFTLIAPGTTTTSGSVTVDNALAYPSTAASIGGSSSDLALQDMGTSFGYGLNHSSPPFTITLSGLVSGRTYQLDLIEQSQFNVPATYTMTDANGSVSDSIAGAPGTYYDVRETLVADSLGQIVVTMTNASDAPDTPYLNAFSLTTPEPASLGLVGLVALLIGRRARRR
jgi:hypothetical protein